ncbi:hypothetical protein B0H21DRAFT_485590 [Amylocystis lapponica]|nr:hypothetical protein B0H21DRAFT_485590 [Amylocystis lapponica]
MVIVDEKMSTIVTPPPYVAAGPLSPPPFPSQASRPTHSLGTLTPHLLLRIVLELFPPGEIAGQRRILYWLGKSLRRVNRALFVACMHVLRSTYLPSYNKLVHPPYSSDPFPMTSTASDQPTGPSLVLSLQRETRVLDLFIALKVREDVWTDESELHLEREESFKDLFDLMQPRSRIEDLVLVYGTREGVVASGQTSGSSSRRRLPASVRPIPFSVLSVSFSHRRVGLVLTTSASKRTIVDVVRTRDETLEAIAKKLVKELRTWLCASPH